MAIRTVCSVALAAGLLAALAAANPALSQDSPKGQVDAVKIRINVQDKTITATLENTRTVRDFIALLPLIVTLKDYASTEKIADLPRKLNTEDAPAGIDPSVGDITYYAPWGNLAIFYKDFGYSTGLVRLGKIDSGIEVLRRPGPLPATIELIEK
jgi:hypothetical protein